MRFGFIKWCRRSHSDVFWRCDFFEARSLCSAPGATFLRRNHSAAPRIASLQLHSLTLSFSSHSASPLSSDAVVLLSLSMFFWCFALAFGVMLSPCCRSPRSSRGYAVVLLLCSSGTCMMQLLLAVIHPQRQRLLGCFWGSPLQLDFVFVQFSKPMDDSCHVLQWICLLQWDFAIISHLFCHQHRDDACCLADLGGCCIWT